MPRALFICGSHNQTTQMHAVARALPEFECAFSPFYGDTALDWLRRARVLEGTIMGDKLRGRCLDYLRDHDLTIDVGGQRGDYQLVVTCTDLVIPSNVRGGPVVVVQEGMTDPETWLSRFVQRTRLLPLWVCSTTLTGLSGRYTRFCVASDGYRRLFIERGAPADKLVVTGIPNFDNCQAYCDNDLDAHGYLLLCTTDMRETFRRDNRKALLRRVRAMANGRDIHIKLHPNERLDRALREIARHCPQAIVHRDGSAEELVANCDVLVTQYSTLAHVGLALGKEVHSYFDMDELRRLTPIQNGGTSAHQIADVCREVIGDSNDGEPLRVPRRGTRAEGTMPAAMGVSACAS